MTFVKDSVGQKESEGQITMVRDKVKAKVRDCGGKQRQHVWLLEEQTRGMCSIRGNRMHSLNQLPANPVAQSHILILITAQVGDSHLHPSLVLFQNVTVIFSFIYLFAESLFVNSLLHDENLCKHKYFLKPTLPCSTLVCTFLFVTSILP